MALSTRLTIIRRTSSSSPVNGAPSGSSVTTSIATFFRSDNTRDARAISLGMYAVFSTGVALWLAYGILVGSWPVLLANLVTLAFALSILYMKVRYDRDERR